MRVRSCRIIGLLLLAATCVVTGLFPAKARARETHRGTKPFAAFTADLERAISAHKMGLVCLANAQNGARSIGVTIPGNQVFMVFRPDFAVRMLRADARAGIEAPLRLYVTENPDGTATVSYRTPSEVFAPYQNAALDTMAKELDAIFARIIESALR
ncbi:MAG: DUF302 domain-containing protein [Candidatus Tectomicrobia bacterium]|nr:DUF302 domain-containing protein [Candidatus Tectomicrobia bacterium]